MASIEFRPDLRDIFFTAFEYLGADRELLNLEPFKEFDRETLEATIEEAAKIITSEIVPTNKIGDVQGLKFENNQVKVPEVFHKIYRQLQEGGWLSLTSPPEWGGQGFPELFGYIFKEMIMGANVAFSLGLLLTRGVGNLIYHFGSQEQKETYCEKLFTGEWSGTMCLTEPQAGSDVGAATTTATPNGDHYLISGTKIFITNGEHDLTDNIIHAVLARTPNSPPGSKGLSLFIVPKYLVNPDGTLGERNDVICERIEHKMGIHASPTCVMNFGPNGKCVGYLLGEEGKGIKYMFLMMNEARLGVGIQGLASAAAAYLSALAYAQQRKQGPHYTKLKDPTAPKVEIIQHPDVRRMLATMKAYVEGIRSLLYATAIYIDQAQYHPDPEERKNKLALVELLIPICKAYSTDKGFKVTELAVQTYGGYGYTNEYPVEQYLRDVKIASIYEGTNGIQAIDLLFRKIQMDKGQRFKIFSKVVAEKLKGLFEKGENELARALESRWEELQETAFHLTETTLKGDVDISLLSATPFLEMFGNFAAGLYLSEAAAVAKEKLDAIFAENNADTEEKRKAILDKNPNAAFYHDKYKVAQFFIKHILVQNSSLAEELKKPDRSAMELLFSE